MSSTAHNHFASSFDAHQKASSALPPSFTVVEGGRNEVGRVAWPLIIVLFVTVVLTLALPLVMNTQMAQRAYEIREMKVELAELKTQTGALERELMAVGSPQELAEKAESLGLVPAAAIGVISLDEGTVEGGEVSE